MSRYAQSTEVSSDRSRGEIERTLTRYGASAFMYGWDGPKAVVAFNAKNRYIRFELPIPAREVFAKTPGRGQIRSPAQREAAYEQAVRQRWRALALVIKAKLEAVDSGITTFENEFLANIVLPDNQTVGDWIKPQVANAYETGSMPKLLGGPS
jgi:hypothetical protein